MTQKQELRLDYHYADSAEKPFIGIFATTKDAYDAGESPDGDDLVQIAVNPRDRVVSDLLQDAAECACKAANECSPSSAAQALSVAAKSLDESGATKNPAVAAFAEAFRVASQKTTGQPKMKIFEFGMAPNAKLAGFDMLVETVVSTDEALLKHHADDDAVYVRGPSIHSRPGFFEFGRFENKARRIANDRINQTDRYWLYAFGPNSSYSDATVIRASEENEAKTLGLKVAMRELDRFPGSIMVQEILTQPKDNGLYSILLPEAKIMIDTHWEKRDVICDHWASVIEDGSKNPVRERQREM